MHLNGRTAATVLTALVVAALGSAAPVNAQAAPHDAGHAAVAKADTDRTGKRVKPSTKKSQKLVRAIAHKDAALVRVQRRLRKLEMPLASRIAGNVAQDREAVAQMTTLSEVRAVRPEVYAYAVNAVVRVVRLSESLATAPDSDVKTQAVEALTVARERLVALRAVDAKGTVRQARISLREAAALVEAALAVEEDTQPDPESETPPVPEEPSED
jgi:hypothetical protein